MYENVFYSLSLPFLPFSLFPPSSDYKPKKIKVENDRDDKKPKRKVMMMDDEASGNTYPSVMLSTLCVFGTS